MFIGKGHPAADLRLLGRGRGWYHLRTAHALFEVAQITLQVGQALLVGLISLGRLLGMQALQLGDFTLQQAQALRGDVVGLRTDLPLDGLIGLCGGIIFIDESTAHGFPPAIGVGPCSQAFGFTECRLKIQK
ncbi:hypothetical protein D3C72_1618040 [compost metagenome]